MFRNIFINFIKIKNASVYYKERFINIVADLSVIHIEILKYYFEREKMFEREHRNSRSSFTSLKGVAQKFSQLTESQVGAFCSDLLRYHLLYDSAIGKYNYERGRYRIINHAVDFLNFVILEEEA